MPQYYTPLNAEGYELCHPVHAGHFELIVVKITGVPCLPTLLPIRMRLIGEDQGRPLRVSDSPWLGEHALIFRPRAVMALGELLTELGELLPLAGGSGDLVMFNPTHVVDALDEDASVLHRFDGGRIMIIEKYAFRLDAIRELDVFKLKGLRASPTVLSQRFVDRWTEAKLRGLEFTPVG